MKFPLEILYIIVTYVDVNRIVRTCVALAPGIEDRELDRIVEYRKNILKYLASTWENPSRLLSVLRKSSSFIVGARAVSYFHPLDGIESEPWCIMCEPHVLSNYRLVQYFKDIGVVWGTTQSETVEIHKSLPNRYTAIFSSLDGIFYMNRRSHTIRLVWKSMMVHNNTERCVPVASLTYFLELNETISQCMISSFGALVVFKHNLLSSCICNMGTCTPSIESLEIYYKNRIYTNCKPNGMSTLTNSRSLCDEHSMYVALDKDHQLRRGLFRNLTVDNRGFIWSHTRDRECSTLYTLTRARPGPMHMSDLYMLPKEKEIETAILVSERITEEILALMGTEFDNYTKWSIISKVQRRQSPTTPF